jgi:hypothetical protein
VIKDELAAYTANIIKRVGAEQAEVLFRGQIGEAGRVAGKALRRGQVSPRFALPSATGAIVSLEERLSYGVPAQKWKPPTKCSVSCAVPIPSSA